MQGYKEVFGEIGIQYDGISPSDSSFEPYLEIAEKLDIPVAIHMGPGPWGAQYIPGLELRNIIHSEMFLR